MRQGLPFRSSRIGLICSSLFVALTLGMTACSSDDSGGGGGGDGASYDAEVELVMGTVMLPEGVTIPDGDPSRGLAAFDLTLTGVGSETINFSVNMKADSMILFYDFQFKSLAMALDPPIEDYQLKEGSVVKSRVYVAPRTNKPDQIPLNVHVGFYASENPDHANHAEINCSPAPSCGATVIMKD